MVDDPYAMSATLVDALRSAGMDEWAERINDVVLGGSTGSEVLMGLRWNLGRVLASGDLPAHIESQARQLYDMVDILLR